MVCCFSSNCSLNDGSFASGQAAKILFDELKKTSLREQFELEQQGKTSSKVELLFLTNDKQYITWLENLVNLNL